MAAFPSRSRFALSTVAFAFLTIATTATTIGCASPREEYGPSVTYYRSDPTPAVWPALDAFARSVRLPTPGALAVPPGPPPAALALCTMAAVGAVAAGASALCLRAPARFITPGRDACARQSVPARTRRKVRVWERDAAV
jgi:hypothetical protein